MSSLGKLLDRILRSESDRNIRFTDLRRLLVSLGFAERTKGGHHIFHREGVEESSTSNRCPVAKPSHTKSNRFGTSSCSTNSS